MAELKKHHRQSLMEHMGLHPNDSSSQYSVWAKYSLKIDIAPEDCSELFMDGIQSGEINFNP